MSTYDGGKPKVRDVHNYQTPKGPINHTTGPGIGDVEPRHGMGGERLHEPGEAEFTGGPGLHGGNNHGNCGSQGKH